MFSRSLYNSTLLPKRNINRTKDPLVKSPCNRYIAIIINSSLVPNHILLHQTTPHAIGVDGTCMHNLLLNLRLTIGLCYISVHYVASGQEEIDDDFNKRTPSKRA